eukprot:73034_1
MILSKMSAIMLFVVYLQMITWNAIAQFLPETNDFDYYSSVTHTTTTHHQVIFDSMNVRNNSIEIEFDIKLNEYCYDCKIIHIDNLISLSINSMYNILIISINNVNVYTVPNVDIFLPADNQYHRFYLSNGLLSNDSTYNQNIIKIDDDFQRYYRASSSSTKINGIHKFYVGGSTDVLNASITNISVNSPIKGVENIVTTEVGCGDFLQGGLKWSEDVDYYYVKVSQTSDVRLDFCGSSYGTYLDIHTIAFDQMQEVWLDNCFPGIQLFLPALAEGKYILEIGADGDVNDIGHDYRPWQLKITCTTHIKEENILNINISKTNKTTDHYYILSKPLSDHIEWFEAERKCEQLYGNTLATIITDEDLVEAVRIINNSLGIYQNISVWIGLYADTDWKWINGINCNYTTSGTCIDDVHWGTNQPDGRLVSNVSYLQRFGGVLLVTEQGNDIKSNTFYDLPFDADPQYNLFFLCNGHDSKYKVRSCTGHSCWRHEHQFSDHIIESDLVGLDNPFMLHWNSTLFIIGNNQVHYSNMKPFVNNYFWHHIQYNENNAWNNAQFYTQYESSVYIYGTVFDIDTLYNEVVLVHVDLNTLQTTQESVGFRENIPMFTKCIVSTENKVYFIQQKRMFIYSTNTKQLSIGSQFKKNIPIFVQQSATTSCILSNDEQFIYIFAMTYHLDKYHLMFTAAKYDIATDTIINVKNSDKCLTRDGVVTATMARNNKVYFQGCDVAGWKTNVFNTIDDVFENTTVNIMDPSSQYLPYYSGARLVPVADNILRLFAKHKNGFVSYSTVTDVVSINLKQTEVMTKVWPTDGFDIQYYINDFSNSSHNSYGMIFYSNDTQNNINISMILNTCNDSCICNDVKYKCYSCHKHFDLKSQLTLKDNDIDELIFTPTFDSIMYNLSTPLIIPNSITIPLQRCIISFTKPWVVKSETRNSITSSFELSSNCYQRIGRNFSVNITAVCENCDKSWKELIIRIIRNTTECKVCNPSEHCFPCNGNQFIIIYDTHHLNNGGFMLTFVSQTLDLKVMFINDTIQHDGTKGDIIWKKDYLYSLLILILPIMILIYCYTQYMNAVIVNSALVLIVPISNFSQKELHLPGVRANVINLTNLWEIKYKYDVFVCNRRKLYSTKQDVIDFIDQHLQRLKHTSYNAIIVHMISHGTESTLMTSDSKQLPIEFIKHELIDAGNPETIKLIFNHDCRGETDHNMKRIRSLSPNVITQEQIDKEYKHEQRIMPMIHPHINNRKSDDMCQDSNVLIINGNIKGGTMSDSGHFTDCICESFGNNLNKNMIMKADLNTLIVEIGRNLEKITESEEVVNREGTLRYNQIRFDQNKENQSGTYQNPKYNKRKPIEQSLLIVNGLIY